MTRKTFSIRHFTGLFSPKPDRPEAERWTVLGAAWIAADTVLVVAQCAPGDQGALTDAAADSSTERSVRSLVCGDDLRLFLVTSVQEDLKGFDLVIGSAHRSITAAEVARVIVDPATLVRNHLAGLEPAIRLEMLAFLSSALLMGTKDQRLIETLHLLRKALRERLPYGEVKCDQPQGMRVDHLLAVDAQSFYVKGWLWDSSAPVTRLTAESPEGSRVELLERMVSYPRPDIAKFYGDASIEKKKSGFIIYFQTKVPSYLTDGWIFEMQNSAGDAIQIKAPTVVRDLLAVRNTILDDLTHRDEMPEDFLEEHLISDVSRLQERYRETIEIERVEQYGEAPSAPDVSIIVPLYKRIDFLEHQLAQFAHDADIFQADLIYVLDSPELADELRAYALQLFRLYRIPFRVVILNRNAGFSTVNNLGASQARGRLLLLLNSDVLPDRPGWLGAMASFYDSKSKIGALGPKLLYEDDSLQHAGMYFLRLDGAREWENMHYYKGLHRLLPAANVVRSVPAVTGACLMIDHDLYQKMGGLQGIYVQGDYEDSDLCLRLIEAGYENWYCPDVELYHLEGQSYPHSLRNHAQQYNRWLQTRLWSERIEEIMAEHVGPANQS